MRDERILHIEKIKSNNFKEVIFILKDKADEDDIITEAYDIINKYDEGTVPPHTVPPSSKRSIINFFKAFWF